MRRVQLWSCGGGRQSAGIAALIVQGRLPKPDHVCMAALEWERRETFRYVNAHVRPALRSLGIPFTYIPRKKYATVDFWSGEDGQSTVLPVRPGVFGAGCNPGTHHRLLLLLAVPRAARAPSGLPGS